MKKISLIFVGVLFLLAIAFGMRYQSKLGVEKFKVFNEANLKGTASYVGIRNHGSSFKLKGDENTYVFYPYYQYDAGLNGNHSFNSFAAPGDSIIKPANADTLILIKNGITYKYVFNRN